MNGATDPVTDDAQASERPSSGGRDLAGRWFAAWRVFALTGLLVLVADLASKTFAFEHVGDQPVVLTRQNAALPGTIPYHEPITVVPYILSLRLVTNTGAVFGWGSGGQTIFIVVTLIAVGVIVGLFCRSRPTDRLLHITLGLILAGALGNLYDRVRFNAVRDLLWLLPDTELWPWVFNVADAALVVGTGVLMLLAYRNDKPQPSA